MKKILLLISLWLIFNNIFALSNWDILANAGIVKKQDTEAWYRLNDYVLRQEVIWMAVKLSWQALPNDYSCKSYFLDVSTNKPNTWICRSVEIAADNWIVSRSNSIFRPEDRITRAEALWIIMGASKIDSSNSSTTSSFWDVDVQWQVKVSNKALEMNIIDAENIFRPNQNATRWEIFEMIKRIIGEGNISNTWTIPTLPSTPIAPKPTTNGSSIKLNTKFELDWMEYELLWFKKIDIIGSNSNPQTPKNNYFLFLEFNYKNISHEYWYNWTFILRDGEDMYNEDIAASVYWKYNLGYDAEIGPLIVGTKRKKYVWFDVKTSTFTNWILRVEWWASSGKYIDIPMKNLIQ